mmetsp:Transcript_1584/g.3972  ORF Transcript_1584/g.3972 Transcript_1584/m.3972 type:complete len:235 (-) Transcript_1584:848-1552(-)
MRSALALVAAAGVALGLEVHEPAHAAGVYAETRADFSRRGYRISGPVSVVEACPCDWLSTADYGSGYGPGSFVGLILVVPGDACTGCSAVEAACAAKRGCERQQEEAYDCSEAGLLLPDGFGEDPADSAAAAAASSPSSDSSPRPKASVSKSSPRAKGLAPQPSSSSSSRSTRSRLRVNVPWYGSRMSSWKESSFWLDHFHEGSLGPMAARRSRRHTPRSATGTRGAASATPKR